MHSIWKSRYSKHWGVIFLFLFRYKDHSNKVEKMFVFVRKLSKLFVVYSVIFDRAIGNVHSFVYSLMSKMFEDETSIEYLMEMIESKLIAYVPYYDKPCYETFQSAIRGNIFYNHKKKNLLCRLSAMLEEDYQNAHSYNTPIGTLYSDSTSIDIEHIESFNHKDEAERKRIHDDWGFELLNSIGNLMILEGKINRGVASNNPYSVKILEKCYQSSDFKIVNRQAEKYPIWNKENCVYRRDMEIAKISDYIFSKS